MAKFYGSIGFAVTTEKLADEEDTDSGTGVWEEVITEYNYTGDVIRNTRRLESGENLNDNITINNMISIIADPFANQNFHAMRYVKWMGANWKITNVEVQRPRLLLTIGGLYNG